MKSRFARVLIDSIVFTLGLAGLLAPFLFPQTRNPESQGAAFPLMVSLIIMLCLAILLFEAQSSLADSKIIALLAILIAINAGLRFIENAIPGPAGFSPIFFLIILTGYFFGSRIGFLMGVMTLLVSALITGGIGPWLPGQMITAGWVGQSSALLRPLVFTLGWKNKPFEVILLAAFGAIWGIIYGAIMNLWFWPFLAASPGQSWLQTASFSENLQRYSIYYLTTSLAWDLSRSLGNIFMIGVLSKPVLRIFQRFHIRFTFQRKEII